VTIIIKKWNPFEYVVTLKALIGNDTRDIRRWDNIRKKDHVDIFFLHKEPKKHQRPPIKQIKEISDLEELLVYIDRNYLRFIKDYKR
jgi:predicted KAP-like P-loop ATPase